MLNIGPLEPREDAISGCHNIDFSIVCMIIFTSVGFQVSLFNLVMLPHTFIPCTQMIIGYVIALDVDMRIYVCVPKLSSLPNLYFCRAKVFTIY